MVEYFKEVEEESVRDNFVICYELLDEMVDFGYPQTTDAQILQEYITQEGYKLDIGAPKPPPAVTNAVSWRDPEGCVSLEVLVYINSTLCRDQVS